MGFLKLSLLQGAAAVAFLALFAAGMNPQRFGHCSVIVGNSMYVFGGVSYKTSSDPHTAGSIMQNLQKFDAETNTWIPVEKVGDEEPAGRVFHSCNYNASAQEIVVMGGTTQAGTLQRKSLMHSCGLSDVWSFNVNTKRWTELIKHAGNCENGSLQSLSFSLGTIFTLVSFVSLMMA